MSRRAVVLMNLGGPDAPAAVRPFLYNLFSDPAIIRLPGALRLPLAALVAGRRAKLARAIYARLGGGSPLLANTEAQARALEAVLGSETRCFIAMRYWHPFTAAAAAAVATWSPDEIVCLPLYPQFSTTTTQSSLAAWQREAARYGLDRRPVRVVRDYPTAAGFIAALVGLIGPALDAVPGPTRLLMSAHGLPQRIVASGDPYQRQIEATAAAVVERLDRPGLDWCVCYQSRVGPLEWIGPSVAAEIRRAAADRVGVVVVPISFVSEHSETLVELDHDYRVLAEKCGVPEFRRVATVGTEPRFIATLAALVRQAGLIDQAERAESRMSGLATAYLWIKALHIISIVAWMAGLLYLPRLFVYHAGVVPESPQSALFIVMERRLLRGIIVPAMIASYTFGGLLAATPGIVDWQRGWIWVKLALVAGLTAFQAFLARWRRDFAAGRNRHDVRFYRIINELPTLALIAIVILVVVKPF